MDMNLAVCAQCANGQITLDDVTRTADDFIMMEMKFVDQTKFSISDMSWRGFNGSRCVIPACEGGFFFNMSSKVCEPRSAGS